MRNRFHALCPYFAMFPESFAERWIERLTRPGDVVLDPFCGRGTTPFQGLLLGRAVVGCDVNPVAYCVSRAKTDPPALTSLVRRIADLERRFVPSDREAERKRLPEFFRIAFAPPTLRQILFLRENLAWRTRRTDCMLAALVLGSLHGESDKSSRFLSHQMPHTISTKPDYSVRFWKARGTRAPRRDAFALLREMAEFRYASPTARGPALVLHDDMRRLPVLLSKYDREIRCVVTSPPYFDVTNFREDQWLRLWFLGGPARPTSERASRDDRHGDPARYWTFIADMWRMLGAVLARDAHVVVRIGATRIPPDRIVGMLESTASFSARPVRLVATETSDIVRRQTRAFRPGSEGCKSEVDLHFSLP